MKIILFVFYFSFINQFLIISAIQKLIYTTNLDKYVTFETTEIIR